MCVVVETICSILCWVFRPLDLLPGIKWPLSCDGPVGQMYPWALLVLPRFLFLKLSYPRVLFLQSDRDAWSAHEFSYCTWSELFVYHQNEPNLLAWGIWMRSTRPRAR